MIGCVWLGDHLDTCRGLKGSQWLQLEGQLAFQRAVLTNVVVFQEKAKGPENEVAKMEKLLSLVREPSEKK